MSVKLMSAIFETEFRDIQDSEGNTTKAATAKLVLLALADHANDEGESAYPSVGRLAKKTALSSQTIRNTFDALRHNGIVTLAGTSKYMTNNYTINTKSFPRLHGNQDDFPPLNPLDPSNEYLDPSNESLHPLNPLDPNHHLTIIESSFPLSIENAIAVDQPITQTMLDKENLRAIAPRQFEKALGFSKPLPWWNGKDWTAFGEWVCERYTEDNFSFGEYNIWRATPYTKGGMNNVRLRGFVNEFYDSWDMFMMSKQPQEKIEMTRLL